MFKDHRDIEEMALGQKARQSPCVLLYLRGRKERWSRGWDSPIHRAHIIYAQWSRVRAVVEIIGKHIKVGY
jgi:hypothetical protein